MGKRKREKDCDDYEYLAYKLKKLERKLKHGRRNRRRKSTDSNCSQLSVSNLEDNEMPRETHRSESEGVYALQSANCAPGPSTSTAPPPLPPPPPSPAPLAPPPPQQVPPPPPPAEHEPADIPPPAIELDSDILEIFGDDPSVVKQYGKEIQTDLAVRLQHIATTGLHKEIRKELCEKYLPPSNCTLIDAPELNPEIKVAISETIMKREAIELKQRQLGRAIACIGEAITILVAKEDKDPILVKLLMDAGRLLCDNQNQDSITRRNFILFNLKKEIKDQIQKSKIDKLLFGADLADTLKTAKSISKSGEELKPAAASDKSTANKNKAAPQPTSAPPQRNNLNWRAPPLNRRPQGNQRTRGPAPRQQRVGSSRTSYRAPQHRYHSRR